VTDTNNKTAVFIRFM